MIEILLLIYIGATIRDLAPWLFNLPREFKLIRWLVWIDQLGNIIALGDYRHTISGRIGWQVFENQKPSWNFAQRIVDWAFFPSEPDHCLVEFKEELSINQFQRGGVLGLIVVTILALFFFAID